MKIPGANPRAAGRVGAVDAETPRKTVTGTPSARSISAFPLVTSATGEYGINCVSFKIVRLHFMLGARLLRTIADLHGTFEKLKKAGLKPQRLGWRPTKEEKPAEASQIRVVLGKPNITAFISETMVQISYVSNVICQKQFGLCRNL